MFVNKIFDLQYKTSCYLLYQQKLLIAAAIFPKDWYWYHKLRQPFSNFYYSRFALIFKN